MNRRVLVRFMCSICSGMLFLVCWITVTLMSSISGQKTFMGKVGKGQDQKMFLIQTAKQVQTKFIVQGYPQSVLGRLYAGQSRLDIYTVHVVLNRIMLLLEWCVSFTFYNLQLVSFCVKSILTLYQWQKVKTDKTNLYTFLSFSNLYLEKL